MRIEKTSSLRLARNAPELVKSKSNDPDLLSLPEAAKYMHVTRHAVYMAIHKKRLVAKKYGRFWFISKSDIEIFRINKHSGDLRRRPYGHIFDIDKGHFSVNMVCRVISDALKRPYSMQHIYYLMRIGRLKAFRDGAAWVITRQDAIELLEKELARSGIETKQLVFA